MEKAKKLGIANRIVPSKAIRGARRVMNPRRACAA
jgi:hypothetical protein